MKIIGLTGGIGSGKSTVSAYLSQKGFLIIDADKIARAMTETGSPVLQELTACFGVAIIKSNGSLDRKALAALAFSSKEQKERLDKIMLAGIIDKIHQQVDFYKKNKETVVFIDAPLLFESKLDEYCTETWVVEAEDDIRIQRVRNRDGASTEEVMARISNQMGQNEKREKADFVLDNSSTPENLYKQIEGLINSNQLIWNKGNI